MKDIATASIPKLLEYYQPENLPALVNSTQNHPYLTRLYGHFRKMAIGPTTTPFK